MWKETQRGAEGAVRMPQSARVPYSGPTPSSFCFFPPYMASAFPLSAPTRVVWRLCRGKAFVGYVFVSVTLNSPSPRSRKAKHFERRCLVTISNSDSYFQGPVSLFLCMYYIHSCFTTIF
jgi:hypothetical protein